MGRIAEWTRLIAYANAARHTCLLNFHMIHVKDSDCRLRARRLQRRANGHSIVEQ